MGITDDWIIFMKSPGMMLLIATCALAGSFGTRGFCRAAEPIQAHLVRRIIGRTVENYDGDKLGKVKDFVVEMPSGRVDYVIISSGGFAGLDVVLKPVPAVAVSLATTKKNTVALADSKLQWEKAPTLRRRGVSLLATDARLRAIYGFYGQAPPGVGTTQAAKMPGAPGGPTRTGNETLASNPSVRPVSALLGSEIIGSAVVNRQRENIGKVSDLLVDFSGQKPSYAIISTRFAKIDRTFAAPLARLNAPVGNKIVIDASREQLGQAKLFDQEIWQASRGSSAGIYRFPERDMENTQPKARDVQKGGLTPFDQSETTRDRRITQRIRQALVNDSLLSMTAKNVKIITINGKATLRGPVRRAEEKEEIARQAAQIAGVQNVENQIEIEGK
jgi:hyperosmotically inducible protein